VGLQKQFYSFVLNKFTGNPSVLNKLGIAVFENPKRTATGSFTSLLETKTVFPSILAVAGKYLLSAPAIKNSFGSPPLETKPVGSLSKEILILFF